MTLHYIYDENLVNETLFQGDVLKRTPELVSVLKKYHPHYAEREDYQYFLVITQSCDLHCRGDKEPKSRYISIAAVRPVEDAIWQEARSHQEWWQIPQKIISDKGMDKIRLFADSLINNNTPNYFYLHEELTLGISGRSCAFLALSVALRVEHYPLCLKAKIAQLKNEFQSKLGWLIGDLYSRVGTVEWDSMNEEKAIQLRKRILKDLFVCVPENKLNYGIKEIERTGRPLRDHSPEEIVNFVLSNKPVKKSVQFSENLKKILDANIEFDKPISKEKLINKLHSSIISDAGIKTLLQRLD